MSRSPVRVSEPPRPRTQATAARLAPPDPRYVPYTECGTFRTHRSHPYAYGALPAGGAAARVVEALEGLDRRGLLFQTPAGGHIDINNCRGRQWTPALEAAGVQHRRIYDLRHTYATWSLAAGIDIFTLARRMGTRVKMIDRTYGHLVAGADEYERELLDRFDNGRSERDGRDLGGEEAADAA